jgi:hypothetical protein
MLNANTLHFYQSQSRNKKRKVVREQIQEKVGFVNELIYHTKQNGVWCNWRCQFLLTQLFLTYSVFALFKIC